MSSQIDELINMTDLDSLYSKLEEMKYSALISKFKTIAENRPLNNLISQYLVYLKKFIKFNPKVIYDIGAGCTVFSIVANAVFPEADIYYFDAFEDFKCLYKKDKSFIGCLSDEDDKIVKFYDDATNGDYRVKSYYKPESSSGRYDELKTYKLDTVVKKYNFPLPDLVKINTCGSEYDIIKGGSETISNAKYIITTLQNEELFKDAVLASKAGPYIESLNFKVKEVLNCYDTPLLDYVFENKNL
jgi:FkbM family methyltransferase